MIFHENRLLADYSHVISYLILSKIRKVLQNLLSAAVVIGALGANLMFHLSTVVQLAECKTWD